LTSGAVPSRNRQLIGSSIHILHYIGNRPSVAIGTAVPHVVTFIARDGQNQRVLTIGVVVLGITDGPQATEFWRQALGYELRTDGFGGWATVLEPPGGGPGTKIALQRSREQVQEHPRIHLDLHVADRAEQQAEVARLVSIGAERVAWDRYPDDPDFVVLADPDGNRFCVVDLGHEAQDQ
jgi:catechol 2,3-dioxygenase-like lactoylglutathione lyase family enzyme